MDAMHGTKKTYQSPLLQPYGDLREVTHSTGNINPTQDGDTYGTFEVRTGPFDDDLQNFDFSEPVESGNSSDGGRGSR